MAAAEGVLISDGTTPLDTARRHELGEQLRDRIRRAESGASAAALAAADLAVAIHTTVPNPATTVFWDAGGHAEAYRHLLGLEPSTAAPPAPGRAVSEAVGVAVARMLQDDATVDRRGHRRAGSERRTGIRGGQSRRASAAPTGARAG